MSAFWVFLGGGLGAFARFSLVGAIGKQAAYFGLPLGVFLANCLGCFLLGVLSPILLKFTAKEALNPLLVVGFLGGFTTFSTYIFDSYKLALAEQPILALSYCVGSILIGFAALGAGLFLSQTLTSAG